jgi:hypothetical protein
MYNKIAVGFFILLLVSTQTNTLGKKQDKTMNDQLLIITAKCKENEKCLFKGEDLFLDIKVTNNQNTVIDFPLEFIRKSGPLIKLTDIRTQTETYLKPNLADQKLREKFTPIPISGSVSVEWVIMSEELKQFGNDYVDVSAEIIIMADIRVKEEKIEFRDSSTLRIISPRRSGKQSASST